MTAGPPASDARLAQLEAALRALEARLAVLERSAGLQACLADEPDANPSVCTTHDLQADLKVCTTSDPISTSDGVDLVTVLTLVGRALMVLGGAYFLRALTEAAVWPVPVGVTLGFAYAAAWLVVADRVGARARSLSAIFHGCTAGLIALPLLWEAATRFHVVGSTTASVILTAASLAALAVAVRSRLQTIAWFIVGGMVVTSVALTAATGDVLPFAVTDIIVGVVTLWIGYTIDWVWLRWPVAAAADLAVLALAVGATAQTPAASASATIAVQLLLLTGYLASVAVRTLVRGRDVNAFEALQSIAALAVGFGGAIYVAEATHMGGGVLAAIATVSGAGCYAVAFAFVARRQGLRHNFYFYTSVGVILVLAGSALGVSHAALLWAALAVLAAWSAGRTDRLTLTVHAAVYFVAAAAASGLVAATLTALVGPPIEQSRASLPFLVVFVAGGACLLSPQPSGETRAARYARGPRLAIAFILASAAAGWLVALVVSPAMPAGVVATIRTAVLAATALVLAWMGRRDRLREAAWLVYPVLIAGAVKLLAEDLPRSTPSTLFVALAAYGAALIAAPRLGFRSRS